MSGIKIVGTGRAVPSKKVTNDDLSKIVETSDEWITTRTGIKSRYMSNEDERNYLIATKAAKKAIENAGISKDEIGACICATITPDYATPSTACMIQKELGLNENIMAFDINAACSGFIYGLKLVSALFETIDSDYILLVGTEQLSRITDMTDRTTCILFGDGSGAAVIKRTEAKFYSEAGARGDNELLVCKSYGNENQYLSMDGKGVFRFAVSTIPKVLDKLLNDAGYTMDDIDYVICHQANERIIASVQNKYKGHEDKFYMNLQEYGNTSSASIPIVIDEMMEKGLLTEGKKAICVGFGAGLTWAGAILEF